jgi:hypothetical protein
MTHLIKLRSHPEIKAVILAAYPHYCTQTAYVGAFSEQGQNVNTYWVGGSRDMYAVVELATGQAAPGCGQEGIGSHRGRPPRQRHPQIHA